jgi:hypothetical protein
VAEANTVAVESFALAAWAHGELKAVVTLENPRASYIWQFAEQSTVELDNFAQSLASRMETEHLRDE